ncbi:hypothetical protein Scep_002638 [Stephania cephalantha]|uniref:Uncharacterized protein n=1 Tax=Stephania cephalantha TaxID=152367 RepID=A0AAP0LBY0_9MAGN
MEELLARTTSKDVWSNNSERDAMQAVQRWTGGATELQLMDISELQRSIKDSGGGLLARYAIGSLFSLSVRYVTPKI